MRKLHFAYLLAFAPILMGANDTNYGTSVNELIVNALPKCGDTEYLMYSASGLVCKPIVGTMLSVPDCNKSGQLLTATKVEGGTVFSCTDKGSESLDATDITTINTTYSTLTNLNTTLTQIEMAGGMRGTAAKFCGVTTGTTNGAIVGNGQTGVAGAAYLCSQVAACGAGARMCSVYDMYNSVANGTITQATQFNRAWVFMASWQNFSSTATDPAAGQNDNCGGYTYPTADREWSGTQVAWDFTISKNPAGPTTIKALKFFTRIANAACNDTRPIACCK